MEPASLLFSKAIVYDSQIWPLLQESERKNLVPFIDATELLARNEDPIKLYFSLDQHLNPAGPKFLAEELLKTPLKAFLKGA